MNATCGLENTFLKFFRVPPGTLKSEGPSKALTVWDVWYYLNTECTEVDFQFERLEKIDGVMSKTTL